MQNNPPFFFQTNLTFSAILTVDLEDQPEFISSAYNHNNIFYRKDTLQMADSKRKLKQGNHQGMQKKKKKGLIINCKKMECIVGSKRDSENCELHIGNVKIKQV